MKIFPFRYHLETSPLYPLFLLDAFLSHRTRHRLFHLLNFILLIFFLIFLAAWFSPLWSALATVVAWFQPRLPEITGATLIFLALWLAVYLLEAFFRQRYFSVRTAAGPSFDAGRILFNTPESDLVIALLTAPAGVKWLIRLGLTLEQGAEFLAARRPKKISLPFEPKLLNSLPSFVGSLVDSQADFAKWLLEFDVKRAEAVGAAQWVETLTEAEREAERWWTKEHLAHHPGLAKDWAYGESYLLNQYSLDLLTAPETRGRPAGAIWYQAAVEQLETILGRSREANALVVGAASAPLEVVYELAALIRTGRIVPALEAKHPKLLRTAIFLSRFKERQGLESELVKIFNEVEKSGNTILILDDLPSFATHAATLGADLEQLFDPYLSSRRIQVIALAETDAYQRTLATNRAWQARFEVVSIEDSAGQTIEARLFETAEKIERRHRGQITFTYQAVVALADLGEQFAGGESAFDQALDFLTEIGPWAAAARSFKIGRAEALKFVSQKLKVPLGAISAAEQEKLLNLEKNLHDRVIGQDQATVAVASALRRSRAGVRNLKRPLGSFLFLGPTGVGKTEMAKALAAVFFDDEERLLRLDMSEYTGPDALKRLIGSFATGEPGVLAKLLREQPYGVLLLDEFEKTDPAVRNLFLQILDEGFFADMRGERVNARNILFIATSNAGAPLIWDLVGAGQHLLEVKKVIIDSLIKHNILPPELLNRFDQVVIFNPLGEAESRAVARLLLTKLADRLKERGLGFQITESVVEQVAKRGADKQFGARPMARFIQDRLEEPVARALIQGTLKSGAEFSFDDKLQLAVKN